MAAGDEADLLIGCRMITSDKKLIRYDDDSSIWMSFEQEQACFSNPRRRSSSCIIGLVKVSLKAMERRKTMNTVFRLHKAEENNYHSSYASERWNTNTVCFTLAESLRVTKHIPAMQW